MLNSGLLDILTNGQINASARLIRLYVGEPGGFSVPLSFYSGVSSNNFQNQQSMSGRSNSHLVYDFVNPVSGLLNVSVDGIIPWTKKNRITKAGLIYQAGERVLTGFREGPLTSANTGQPVNFLSSVIVAGIYLQTGAWEKANDSNPGICWSSVRYIVSITGKKQLRNFLQDINDGNFHAWSLGWGIEISNLISIKFIYFKYLRAPAINYSFPVCLVSFNYSVKK